MCEGFHGTSGLVDIAGIDGFQLAFPEILECFQGKCFAAIGQAVFRGIAQKPCVFDRTVRFHDKAAVAVPEEVLNGPAVIKGKPDLVAQTHLEDGLCNAAVAGGIDCLGRAGGGQGVDGAEKADQCIGNRQAVRCLFAFQQIDRMAGFLKLRGDDLLDLAGCNSKGDQCRRDIELLKGARHGVLAADGSNAEVLLCLKGTEECGERLCPAFSVVTGMEEVFLEGQIDILKGSTGSDELADRLCHGKIGTVIGALFRDLRVIAPGHAGDIVGVSVLEGDLLHHGLNGGQLADAAKGHKDGAGTDGGVKALRQAAA